VLAQGQAAFGAKFDRWLIPPAIIGMVWSVALAHPRLPEAYLYPTWLADRIWDYHPSLNNPPVEVFYERMAHKEGAIGPAATANCSKILLLAGRPPLLQRPQMSSTAPGEDDTPTFVSACTVRTPIPPACKAPSAFCYANKTASGYEIVEAPQ
jgi:hypothetical protein